MPESDTEQAGRRAGAVLREAAKRSPLLRRAFRATAVWAGEVSQASKGVVKTAGWLLFAGVAVVIAINSYTDLDNSGWISRNHDTPIWIQGNWLVGEYRDCQMLTTTPPAGIVLSQHAQSELPRLLCGENGSDVVAGSLSEFESEMSNLTGAAPTSAAIWSGGDWSGMDSYFHVLPVRYNGRIERPDRVYISWHCQRNTSALTCWALN